MEGERWQYELPEEKIFDTNIFSFSKKNRKRPKNYSLMAVALKIEKTDKSLKLAVIQFLPLLIFETILAFSRIKH